MTLLRAIARCAALGAGWLLLAPLAHALEPNDWKYRQTVAIERPGLVKLTLPPATLDAARPALEDLRVLDVAGRETPFLVERAEATRVASMQAPRAFRAEIADTVTRLVLTTGTTLPLTRIALTTPGTNFLKAARVEVSADGVAWREFRAGVPLFRQFGAEQLTLDLERQTAAYVRIEIDDTRGRPVPFTGAMLYLATQEQPAPSTPLASARIARREEFTGETVLTLDLGARHVPLASVTVVARDAVFMRKVAVLVHDETAFDRTLGGGTVYRLAAEGIASSERLDVPLGFDAPSRELIVRIENGDSPPLAIDGVTVAQNPRWIVFSASAAGTYTLLAGNPGAAAPHYDLSRFAATLNTVTPTAAAVSALEPNPTYRERDPLADTPLLGAPLDPAAWRLHKAVQVTRDGVQQLELDVEVLAANENGFADLRLVRERTQVPYILERPGLTRTLSLAAAPANDPKRPRLSRWQAKLPHAHTPIVQFTVASPTPLFQRQIRLFQIVTSDGAEPYEQTLATMSWNKSPADQQPLTFAFSASPTGDTLWIETDNGDNPAIALDAVKIAYPVVRLLFKAQAGPLELYYGNRNATAPRYDISLIADQIMAAEKSVATLERGAEAAAPARPGFAALRAGVLFWCALGLVVVVLLVVVAKLLPKPPAA